MGLPEQAHFLKRNNRDEAMPIAVRIGKLHDSSLAARRFASQDMVLCASPRYLEHEGSPGRVEDLASHSAIVFRNPSSGRIRPWELSVAGKPLALTPSSRLLFSDGEAMVAAALHGLGIAQVPDYMVSEALDRGALVEVLAACRPASLPIHAVMPANRMVPARVRVLLEALSSVPASQLLNHTR